MCKTPIADYGDQVTVRPMQAFPLIKDLVTDVSWNYEVNKQIPPFTPSEKDMATSEPWRMQQKDVERVMEFRKCIECFLCQDVCHVLRNHDLKSVYYGPRFMVRIASLEMHPKDVLDRRPLLKGHAGVGYCNITKCCQEVCPEHIHITDNAIIPLKERMDDVYFDPIRWLIDRRKPRQKDPASG
jgi:succinate dehydrogenase / fumarate reductase iron-sulfur subunit